MLGQRLVFTRLSTLVKNLKLLYNNDDFCFSKSNFAPFKGGVVMKTIASFQIDHEKLEPGIYISRVNSYESKYGDIEVKTFDLRFTRPNREEPIDQAALHTIEHLGATFLRSDPTWGKAIVYFGPMGCRTGFYLIMQTIFCPCVIRDLIINMCKFIVDYNGPIPGATAKECGNYLEHDIVKAKYYAKKYMEELTDNFHDEYPK